MTDPFKKICRSAGNTIVKHNLIGEGDRILVALSGGKDSWVMMHVLDHLQKAAPVNFSLIAATFDPGFEGFNTDSIAEYCKKHNWEHHCVKLNIPEIITEKHFQNSPCVLCSRLRRGKLYGLAGQLQCGKLALGQHLDDIIISFMMSVFRGQGLHTMAPSVKPDKAEHPTVIRILADVQEKMIAEAAEQLQVPLCGKCIYREQLLKGDRQRFKKFITALSSEIPDLHNSCSHSLGIS